jgi:hypothetical protein
VLSTVKEALVLPRARRAAAVPRGGGDAEPQRMATTFKAARSRDCPYREDAYIAGTETLDEDK